jgi:hypothetical protein
MNVIATETVIRPSFLPRPNPMDRKLAIIRRYFQGRDPAKPLYTPEINHILRLAGAVEGEFDCPVLGSLDRYEKPSVIQFKPKDKK